MKSPGAQVSSLLSRALYIMERNPTALEVFAEEDILGKLYTLLECRCLVPGQRTRSYSPQPRLPMPQVKILSEARNMEKPACRNQDLAQPNTCIK